MADIANYVGLASERATRAVLDSLHSAMERLGEMPEIGHRRLDLADAGTKFWIVYPYVIVYRPGPPPIHVLRILSGYRDLRELLR